MAVAVEGARKYQEAAGPGPAWPATAWQSGAPEQPAERKAPAGRISGIDMARALAIVGMLAVHMGPTGETDLAGRLYGLTHGRASVLFMLVAGVGVAMLVSSRHSSLGQVRGQLAWRALLLLPLGLFLQPLDHNVLVILQQYGAMFLLGIAVVGLRGQWLLALAAASATLGSLGFLAGHVLAPDVFDRAAVSIGDSPGDIVHGLLLSGPYPLIVWAAPFLLGIWLGHRNLRSGRVQVAMVLGGGLVAVLAAQMAGALENALGEPEGWQRIVVDDPHSQMPLWITGSMGSAAMVLGLSLAAANALGRLVWPLAAMGQLALTVYVAHVLALHRWRDTLSSDEVGQAALVVLGFTAAAAVAAVTWRVIFPRGPLEGLLRPPWVTLPGVYRCVARTLWRR